MSFVLQRQTGRGFALTQLRGDTLRIGRGTNAELRSENPAVALEHAVIERVASGYVITDKGSITGTYVNRRPVETATLARGDVIEIGDLRVEVQVADADKPLFLRMVPTAGSTATREDLEATTPPGATSRGGKVRAKKIDYVGAYRLRSPYFTRLTLVAVVAIASLAVIAEVTQPGQQTVFMPGGVSSAHARARDAAGRPIAENCSACHNPWRGVSDSGCISCHAKEPHSKLASREAPCVDCHLEHRASARLAIMGDGKCVSCHGDLSAHERSPLSGEATASPVVSLLTSNPQIGHIDSFGGQHPEFAPLSDPDTLRFNHALHLRSRGILNGSGLREQLQCAQCHKLVETRGKADPKAVRFEQDCQRCHRLTFDRRFPDLEVPHGGDPGLVYGFVLAAYAGNRDIAGKSPDEVRRILTSTSRPRTSTDESAVLNAEQVVKAKCTLCHEIRRGRGRLAATPPVLRTRWLEHARFGHTAHRNLACESCHDARRSTATSDVLMPARNACVACHGAGAASKVSSSCVTCHEYHERSKLLLTTRAAGFASTPFRANGPLRNAGAAASDGGGNGMLGTVLVWAVILLILVVLLPVGIALYQRVRSSAPEADARPAVPPAQPETTKVPALMVEPPPAPVPSASKPFSGGRTTQPDLPAIAPPPASATEAIQWYGMLRCTGGPLEGQTFIVDDEGLYIGRDSTLSKIVIPDERVSKRHVRIMPRNGKVFAIDQNSTNGTFLAKAGEQRITEVQLKRGDVLVLADNAATFIYQI